MRHVYLYYEFEKDGLYTKIVNKINFNSFLHI